MVYVLEKSGTTRCALDAAKNEAFTQRPFADLIFDSHSKGYDYYIARVHCIVSNTPSFYCYDAKQLCKFIFEMVISSEGRKIRIKNFKDPIHSKDINEINFFKLRFDTETPLRAEYIGNHISFLESNVFRKKIFFQEDALDALSVNFQFNTPKKITYIKKKKFSHLFFLLFTIISFGALSYLGIKKGRTYFVKKVPTPVENSSLTVPSEDAEEDKDQ